MSVKLLLFFSAVCFAIVGVIYFLVYRRGWDFLNSTGKAGTVPEVKDKSRRSKEIKEAALKEIARAKARLAPGSEKSSEFLQALGESDPEFLASSVKKWLSEEGDDKLKK